MPDRDAAFSHSTPELYDRFMGPLLFEPYARLIAERCALLRPARILETAAGTGILTAAVNRALPDAEIVASDINPAVLEFAARRVRSEKITFRRADAQDLPYAAELFDVVLCQFGMMFIADKVVANREARRVLRSGGCYLMVTFDRLELNPVPKAAEEAVAALFPNDPPVYMKRGPFSYADPAIIERDLRAAGFSEIALESTALPSAVHARDAALGIVLGSPFRAEIERRDASALDRMTHAVEESLRRWDGQHAPVSAHVVTAKK